jgi:hypothetical protein
VASEASLELPELAAVHWRPRVDEARLRRAERVWTLSACLHTIPFLAIAALLMALAPLAFPVAAVAVVHAWAIPGLYVRRGINVVRPKALTPPTFRGGPPPEARAELTAMGLLGDLVGHQARDLLSTSGLVLERGRLGVWLVGEAGALLVRPGGRRVHCYCVHVSDRGARKPGSPLADASLGANDGRAGRLPRGDRIAHLLLALRADEAGFATVANRAFAGASWRLRRVLPSAMRPALAAAVEMAARQTPDWAG